MSKRHKSSKDRLLSRIKITSDMCWEWQGAKLRGGYGNIRISGKSIQVHRLAYELYHGEIPDDKIVCHHCDNPSCCNPDHLFLGTHKTNSDDKIAKDRIPLGEDVPNSKLKESEVLEIRRYLNHGITHRVLAKMFGVGKTCISYIAESKTWRWL